MDIVISNTSDKPIYRQLSEQLRSKIINGELAEGFCLPPIRRVALELGVSVITVKKAWEELERDGYIKSYIGKGCFVAPHKMGELTSKRYALAEKKAAADMEYYKSLGLSKEELINLIEKYY